MSANLKKKKPVARTEYWQIQKDAEHFFVSSYMWWSTGTDLLEVLARQAKLDKANGVRCCNVYKVPVPESADYQISDYRPQVEGAEFVTVVEYEFKPKKK